MRVLFGLLLLALSALVVCVSAQTVVNPDATNTFHFTNGNGASWTVTANGQQLQNPTLNMTIGTTYFISIEFNTANVHPFGLNTNNQSTAVSEMGLVSNSSCGGTAAAGYTFASNVAPFCVLSFTPNANTPTGLYYHCVVHPAMAGKIQVNSAGGATTAPTGSGTGTGTPTNSSGTTSTPTPTGSTPTTHSSASALVPAVAAVFAAVAVAVAGAGFAVAL